MRQPEAVLHDTNTSHRDAKAAQPSSNVPGVTQRSLPGCKEAFLHSPDPHSFPGG